MTISAIRTALLATAMVFAAGAFVAAPASAVPYYVTSGQSNANTQIDLTHTSSWLFSLASGGSLDLGGGDFTIKRGTQASLPLTLSLYQGADASGLLVDQVSVAASAVGQSYGVVHFGFANSVLLEGGTNGASYYLVLSSQAANAGSQQYFIKGVAATTFTVSATGSVVTPPSSGQATVAEPISAALLGAGMLGMGMVWRRRDEKRAEA